MTKISIIIPAYNAERTVADTIQSVLKQTYANIEIVVCNDASTDDTVGVLKKFNDDRIVILSNEMNLGPGTSRNKAMSVASGDWFALIDADDTWEPTRLETLLRSVKFNPRLIAFDNINFQRETNGGFFTFKKLRNEASFNAQSKASQISVKQLLKSPTTFSKLLFSKSLLIDTNATHSSHTYGEDSYFMLHLMSKCEGLVYTPEALYNYRISDTSASSNIRKYELLIDAVSACVPLYNNQPDIQQALLSKIKRQKQDKQRFEFSQLLKNKQFSSAISYFVKRPLVLYYLIKHNVQNLLNR